MVEVMVFVGISAEVVVVTAMLCLVVQVTDIIDNGPHRTEIK